MTKYIISIDLGGTNLRIGLFDQKIKLKDKLSLNTKRFASKWGLIQSIIDSIKLIIKKNKLSNDNISGVGVGLPGPTDYASGIVYFFPNIPGWRNVNLKKILTSKLNFKFYFENDANLMTLAEYKIGAAAGYKNGMGITLGTGVGGGVIINGELFRGSKFAAGEIGHLPINEKGPSCNCGGRACIEIYVGNQRILNKAKRVFKKEISLEDLSRFAARGNLKAVKIWRDVGERLGIALAGAVNLLNPDFIVVGGGVSRAGKILFDTLRRTVKKRAMIVQGNHVKIIKAKLGVDAGIIGAAILVKQRGAI
jgi:glucokinase